ncbi:MAG: tetratricopeptide (TPR) repeat protein [Lentimonas sp.]|jgi:tetratricopeptide (TPR) repeat protein
MYPYFKYTSTLSFALLAASSALSLQPQMAYAQSGPEQNVRSQSSQLGFSELQAKANTLVEMGQLIDAIPLLTELIQRVEQSENSGKIELDFPLFILGTGYIQKYVATGQKAELREALKWYDKLQADYPLSPKNKDADMKRIDLLRVLGQFDQATDLMIKMVASQYNFRLLFAERLKILTDLCRTFYATNKLQDGLPYFELLLTEAKDIDDRGFAAAAAFEAYVAADQLDLAIKLIPNLAVDSKVRYGPQLNVALLRTSDKLAAQGRLNDTAIILSLIKKTDAMIGYNEAQLVEKQLELQRRTATENSQDRIDQVSQEITMLETQLKQLKTLPALNNEILVRRARNYTLTGRRYEAFWMFYDLSKGDPKDPRIEFYTYATFSNAQQIGKKQVMRQVGADYRSKFPDGEYFSDISVALATELNDSGDNTAFLEIATSFLSTRPMDPSAANLLAQWGSYLFSIELFDEVIAQCDQWLKTHKNPIFMDGLYYWKAMGLLQIGQFEQTIVYLDSLLKEFPTSLYAEDALLRKGTSLFYAQDYNVAQKILLQYTETYSQSNSLDQAFYFLGQIQMIAGNPNNALAYFDKAMAISDSQSIYDSIAFSRGSIYEQLQQYETMTLNFQTYIDTFGAAGRLTDAILQLGRAHQLTQHPTKMLNLYSEAIRAHISNAGDTGVDSLIEAYAEAFESNKIQLVATNKFLDDLRDDLQFRNKIVTDRGFLFEFFYTHPTIEQSLYNKLRSHPKFNSALLEDISPIADLTAPYREELKNYPTEIPEEFFRDLLARSRANGDRFAETRALMGLYRVDIELAPQERFDEALLEKATPRVTLFIADYERQKRRDFAVKAWERILSEFPSDDAAIVAYMRLADVSAEENRPVDALEYLEAIEANFPGSPQISSVLLRQGELLSEMGQGDAARAKYQYILRVPDWRGEIHAKALLQTGDSYIAEANYAAAHGFYERTFLGYSHFAPLSAQAYLSDADALLKMGMREDAIATLTEAIDRLAATVTDELILKIKLKLQEIQE